MTFLTQSGHTTGPIGQGTWYLGENPSAFGQECKALQAGIRAGMNLIDTAEMYGDGAAEKLVGAAIKSFDRENLYLVSKVYPHNAGKKTIFRCCENSLRRMNTDYLDLYLLHWRGTIPLLETAECMEQLKARGLIQAWGVSNFDTADMIDLTETGMVENCAANQVLYHLGSRGIEYELLPWLREHNIPVMAYCPLAQAGQLRKDLMESYAVRTVAATHHVMPFQILLAFLLSQNVVPIPRTSQAAHAAENAAAAWVKLTEDDLAVLDRAFPAPRYKTRLEIV